MRPLAFEQKHKRRAYRVAATLWIAVLASLFAYGPTAHAQSASQPFLGQIFAVAFDFAPKGFAECNGQLLPINQNQALFSLLGTTYGGNGTSTFGLPDLRGRVAVDASSIIALGEKGGEETHTLTSSEMPVHTHQLEVSTNVGTTAIPDSSGFARDASGGARYGVIPSGSMNSAAVGQTGSDQPHENRMPFVVIHYIIALQGIFPARN